MRKYIVGIAFFVLAIIAYWPGWWLTRPELSASVIETSYNARALKFGTAITDLVDVGSNASLDTVNTWTMMIWAKPTSLVAFARLFRKAVDLSPFPNKSSRLSGTAGDLQVTVGRATTDTSYITNSTPLAVANAWYCIAITYNSAAAPVTHIYTSNILNNLKEATYGTATDGSGAVDSDSAANLCIGNGAASACAAPDNSFSGNIAIMAHFNVVLTIGEMNTWMGTPMQIRRGLVGLWFLGENGRGLVMDYSGQSNEGTITGAIPVEGISLFLRSARALGPAPIGGAPPLNRLLMGAGR